MDLAPDGRIQQPRVARVRDLAPRRPVQRHGSPRRLQPPMSVPDHSAPAKPADPTAGVSRAWSSAPSSEDPTRPWHARARAVSWDGGTGGAGGAPPMPPIRRRRPLRARLGPAHATGATAHQQARVVDPRLQARDACPGQAARESARARHARAWTPLHTCVVPTRLVCLRRGT